MQQLSWPPTTKFCVLPNGLAPFPCWFTKLYKPPLAKREKKKRHDLSANIDDIYLKRRSELQCIQSMVDSVQSMIDSIKMLRSLDFAVHAEKSNLRINYWLGENGIFNHTIKGKIID